MRVDTSPFIRHAVMGYGEFSTKRLEYTYPNGDRVRWILYDMEKGQQQICGMQFTKIMIDLSMAGLDMQQYLLILSKLRGRKPS